MPHIQSIRPIAELAEHCPAVLFYWRLVFVNVSGLLHCWEAASQRGCCVRVWLSSTVPSNQTAIFTLFYKPLWTGGTMCGWIVTLPIHTQNTVFRVHSVSWAESNCSKSVFMLYFHHFFLFSLPLCLSRLLNSLHPLFHGALSVAGAVTPRQDLGLK